ncbi:MAG: GNAT family N-acetyltransferase [Paenisporosarcina sp.]|nr:GNAT family N-acetyltransferase [Paenisporosarcina sp.]
MDISLVAVSFPVDQETAREIMDLVKLTEKNDLLSYEQVLNLYAITDESVKGFVVLAYAEEMLVGVVSAIDMIGVHSYEWSGLVVPGYRKQGIGRALVSTLNKNLEMRGAESELALTIKDAPNAKPFFNSLEYEWNFSEATLQAKPTDEQLDSQVHMYPLTSEHDEITQILMDAFGDTEEEVQTLLNFNVSSPSRHVYVAKMDDVCVGTATVVEDDHKFWITALATDASKRGQGVGSAILRFVLAEAKSHDVDSVMLDVEIDNTGALSIYEKAGFKTNLQVDYYIKNITN